MPSSAAEKDDSKLSAVVTYKTRCTNKNEEMVLLLFGLGKAISVNAILGLPTLRDWKIMFDVDENKAISKELNRYFELSYWHAAFGSPSSITFTKDDFVRPPQPNQIGKAIATHLSTTTMNPIVLTSVEDGVMKS